MATARLLASGTPSRPSQANLRTAISCCYYALFHALARSSADLLVGRAREGVNAGAWQRTYRAQEHAFAAQACARDHEISSFPSEIRQFARGFVNLQRKRHSADYDPFMRGRKSEVLDDIEETARLLDGFLSVPSRNRRAFAACVLFRQRRS